MTGPSRVDGAQDRPLYAVLEAILVAIGGMVGAIVASGVVYLGLTVTDAALPMVASFGLSFVAGAVGFVAVAVIYLRYRGLDPVQYVGVHWPTGRDLGWVVGGYVAALALVIASGIVLTALQVNPETTNRAAEAGLEQPALLLWLVPLSFLVIAPGEEFLFRGTIQSRLRETFSPTVAIPLTAALFAVLHFFSLTGGAGGRFVAISILFLPSLVFGVVYEYTDNLVVSTLLHGAYNSTLVLLVYLTLTRLPTEELTMLA
ncbi:CPBP family intramembrane glutamic endopeptidase [Halanaeroarchaeum sulfurireducens]|nr:type II CAAX endopeptidase family protein [Halanaeroarchaeum sulfurireducens]